MAISLYVFVVLGVAFWFLARIFGDYVRRSSLDNLSGPAPASFLLGSLSQVFARRDGWKQWRSWVDTYGPVWKLRGLLGRPLLHVSDPRALHSILIKDMEYYPKKLSGQTTEMDLLLGPGLLTTEGAQNRKQRKLLNPVFSVGHLRHMTHIFYGIARKLRKAMEDRIGPDGNIIDVNGWMARTTLEMLGQAGLGYSFDNFVDDTTNAYGESLKMFFPVLDHNTIFSISAHFLSRVLPASTVMRLLRLVPHSGMRRMIEISDTMRQRSLEIINEKKTALLKGDDALVHQVGEGQDIMSLLLKANMIASEAERHSDEELVAQMSTFILGGMDTTSNALSRVFHLLAQNPSVQDKLRAEIIEAGAGADNLAYDELVKLPYLEAVCRETLRLYAPVQMIVRVSAKDTSLPLLKPIRGRDGALISEVPVPAATGILLHLTACNMNKDIWGDDADQWRPERWLGELPAALEDARIPGVYSNLMSFSGGGRSCIGFKLAQTEMKVVIAILLSTFKFELSDRPITWNSSAVIYPTTGEESTKPEMFLRLSKVV
ncbi:cytochrome P450 [Trametes polyzona]|nr:cytochrome P450 [Trametes polyzona]